MTAYVYLLKSDAANAVYVGSTGNLDRRIEVHFSQLRTGKHHNLLLQKVWDEHQDVYLSSVIDFPTIEEAEQFELKMIGRFVTHPGCCNINLGTEGGDTLTRNPNREKIIEKISIGMKRMNAELPTEVFDARYRKFGADNPMYGRNHSEESRELMSQKMAGREPPNKGKPMSDEQKALLSQVYPRAYGSANHFYGKTHTDETRAKISEANRGRDNGQGHQIEVDGVVYRSYGEAAKETGIPLVTIRHRCLSQNSKFSNYKLLSKCPTTIESGAKVW